MRKSIKLKVFLQRKTHNNSETDCKQPFKISDLPAVFASKLKA